MRNSLCHVASMAAFSAAAALTAASVAGQSPMAEDGVMGIWETEPEDDGQWSRIEIQRCAEDASRFCGSIVWLSEPLVTEGENPTEAGNPKLDANNPEEALRDRRILGLPLMHSFQFDDGKWKDGRIYDPKSGKTYRCEIQLADEGQRLDVRGFVKVAFVSVGRTTQWTRYVDDGQ